MRSFLQRLFGAKLNRKARRAQKQPASTATLRVEALDDRVLPTVGINSAGNLVISGAGPQSVTVSTYYNFWFGKTMYRVTESGYSTSYQKASVWGGKVIFNGSVYDDYFKNSTSLRTEANGSYGNDYLESGAANDWLDGADGYDTLYGGAGHDTLFGGNHNDTLAGHDGNDSLIAGSGNDWVFGDAGNDTLAGQDGDDWLCGQAGDDSVWGDAGNDSMWGDDGNDFLVGGSDHDDMHGGNGADMLDGGLAGPTQESGDARDNLYGDAGNDTLWGGEANDLLVGGSDRDELHGEAGDDTLDGGELGSTPETGDARDSLFGDAGNDTLWGGEGNDLLAGGAGFDALYGEDGNDGLFGGWEDASVDVGDYMVGGAGADRFLVTSHSRSPYTVSTETIGDLNSIDARITFARDDRDWNDSEILRVDTALSWLHERTNNTRMLKQSRGFELTFGRIMAIGSNTPNFTTFADNDSNGLIRITDAGMSSTTSPIDETVVHEIGHNWDDENPNWTGFMELSGWTSWSLSTPVPSGYTRATDLNGGAQPWIYLTGSRFSRTDGYGRTNPKEDFATCLETYYALTKPGSTANPAVNWATKWVFIDNFLNSMKS